MSPWAPTFLSAAIAMTVAWLIFFSGSAMVRRGTSHSKCKKSPLWDGRVCLIQVTDFSEKAMQLRCLSSSGDSGKSWDLRCLIREELMVVMQRDHAAFMPRVRNEIEPPRQTPCTPT